jgi:hypothetical protein
MNANKKLYFIVYGGPDWERPEELLFSCLTEFSLTEEICWGMTTTSFDLHRYVENLLERMNNDCSYNRRIYDTPRFFSTIDEAKAAITTIKAYDIDTPYEFLERSKYFVVLSEVETRIIPTKVLSII